VDPGFRRDDGGLLADEIERCFGGRRGQQADADMAVARFGGAADPIGRVQLAAARGPPMSVR
jgi:hypothetical protein